jgi:replication factor C subunit 3/5
MKLLFDKYRPRKLDDIRYHKEIANILKTLDINNLPHILMYGPHGSGKKTLLYSFLGYDKKTRIIQRIKTSSKEIPFTMYRNKIYIELDIKEMGMYCKFIIRDILKNMAETRQVSNNLQKIIILHHCELLTIESQFILNKILELHSVNCKFILISNTINNIMSSLQSNCLCLRVQCPSQEEIRNHIVEIIDKEKNINLSVTQLDKLLSDNHRNLKTAILQLEICDLIKSQKASINKKKIQEIVKLILKKRTTLTTISKITSFLYEFIMDNNINSNYILLNIYYQLIEHLDKNIINKHVEITKIASKYDMRLIQGSKDIMHIQAYIFSLIETLNEIAI